MILVIGGTGRTGRLIVSRLMAGGEAARVLSRRSAPGLIPGADLVSGDVTQPGDVERAFDGVSGAVIAVESAMADSGPNSPQQVHGEGTGHVIEAARAAGAKIVLVSQIYITRIHEHPEMAAVIRARAGAEDALRAGGVPYVIVRPSWLIAAGGGSGLRLEQGDGGDGEVSREDVAETCVAALQHHGAVGKTFELYNDPAAARPDWESAFAALAPDRT
jgi:uncharacterized protein YbjT (DUF2867 family)